MALHCLADAFAQSILKQGHSDSIEPDASKRPKNAKHCTVRCTVQDLLNSHNVSAGMLTMQNISVTTASFLLSTIKYLFFISASTATLNTMQAQWFH